MAKNKNDIPLISPIWRMLVSPAFFVVTSILWCLDLAVGSIVAYRQDPKFWMKMDSMPFSRWMNEFAPAELPYSAWVYILAGLTWVMVISLTLCTIHWFFTRNRRKRGMAEVLVHLGFMLVFIGFALGSGWGERVQNIPVVKGERVEVTEMGVALELEGITLRRDAEGKELDTISELTLTDLEGNHLTRGTARLNHPLIHGSTVVYPQGGGERIVGAKLLIDGLGELNITEKKPYELISGYKIGIRGTLEEGQRYQSYVGPGVYVTIADKHGRQVAGNFVGEHKVFSEARVGKMNMTWREPVLSTQALFHVHRDPGVLLVLIGAIILGLGTFWAAAGFFRKA